MKGLAGFVAALVFSATLQAATDPASHHMLNVSQQKFSLAVSGNGVLIPQFVERLKQSYPRVTLYDRNEEAARPPSNHPIPRHPKPADIDVVFVRKDRGESATVRSYATHRYFNYRVDPGKDRQDGMDLILKQMVQAVSEMLPKP